MPKLKISEEAKENIQSLIKDPSKRSLYKQVIKTLGLMESNLRHPSLHTHKYQNFDGPKGQPVFEAYAQNKTPGAYRVFWCYGPEKDMITILAITAHP